MVSHQGVVRRLPPVFEVESVCSACMGCPELSNQSRNLPPKSQDHPFHGLAKRVNQLRP